MKKGFIFLLASILVLTGCGGDTVPSDPVDPIDDPIDEPTYYWDENTDKQLALSIGEQYVKEVPYFDNGTVVEAKASFDDAANVKFTNIKIETTLSSSLANTYYKTTLLEHGFFAQGNQNGIYIYGKEVAIDDGLIVAYWNENKDNKHYFYVQAYVLKTKVTSWPEEEMRKYFDADVIHMEAEYYETMVSDDETQLQIGCFNVSQSDVNEYYTTLKNAGYIVRSNPNFDNAVYKDKKINMDMLYSEEDSALFIVVSKLTSKTSFPFKDIIDANKYYFGYDLNGILPVFNDSNCTYTVGPTILENGETYLTCCSEYAPNNALNTYEQLLLEKNWIKQDDDFLLEIENYPLFLYSDGHNYENFYTYDFGSDSMLIELRYYDPEDIVTGKYYNIAFPYFMIIFYGSLKEAITHEE